MKNLVYATNKSNYTQLRAEVFKLANKEFTDYFEKNWHSCQSMWVNYLRDEYLHLANTTNNRLECHHSKLKDLTSQSSMLSEMFNHVLTFSTTHSLEYSQKSFVEEFTSRTTKFDDISGAAKVAAVCTEHAANLICEQLEVARKVEYQLTKSGDSEVFELTYKDHKHYVNASLNSCSCSFQKTLGLPCRHLFVVRTYLSLVVFEQSMVRERWLKSYQIQICTNDVPVVSDAEIDFSDNALEVQPNDVHLQISKMPRKPMNSSLSQNQKYRKVLEVGQKIAASTSQVGMRDYREKYSQLESLFDYWQRDIPIVIVPKNDTFLKAQIEDEGVEENLSLKQDEQVAAIQLHDCKKSEVDKTVIEFENESAVEMDHFSSVSCVGWRPLLLMLLALMQMIMGKE